jgi:hypothetical protein
MTSRRSETEETEVKEATNEATLSADLNDPRGYLFEVIHLQARKPLPFSTFATDQFPSGDHLKMLREAGSYSIDRWAALTHLGITDLLAIEAGAKVLNEDLLERSSGGSAEVELEGIANGYALLDALVRAGCIGGPRGDN